MNTTRADCRVVCVELVVKSEDATAILKELVRQEKMAIFLMTAEVRDVSSREWHRMVRLAPKSGLKNNRKS